MDIWFKGECVLARTGGGGGGGGGGGRARGRGGRNPGTDTRAPLSPLPFFVFRLRRPMVCLLVYLLVLASAFGRVRNNRKNTCGQSFDRRPHVAMLGRASTLHVEVNPFCA